MSERSAWHQLMADNAPAELTIRPRGHSMEPLVHDRELVTIRRLTATDSLMKNDIVLVKVHGRVFLHKITAIDGDRVQISNNHGHVNGWASRAKIAGKMQR